MQEVVALLDEGVFDMARLAEGGWVDGLRQGVRMRRGQGPGGGDPLVLLAGRGRDECWVQDSCMIRGWMPRFCRYEDEMIEDVKKRIGLEEKEQVSSA